MPVDAEGSESPFATDFTQFYHRELSTLTRLDSFGARDGV